MAAGGFRDKRTTGGLSRLNASDALDAVIHRLTDVRRSGAGWTALCPAHRDREPSLSVRAGDERAVIIKCHRGCEAEDIVRELGLDPAEILGARRDGFTPPTYAGLGRAKTRPQAGGVTVSDLARAKDLPERLLRETFKLRDALGRRVVEMPYSDQDGCELFARERSALSATRGSKQPAGVPLVPYRLEALAEWRASDTRLLVEGESDVWTGVHHGYDVMGLPGAASAGCLQAEHVAGLARLYVHQEPDAGGPTCVSGVRRRLDEISPDATLFAFALFWNGERVKDLNELHQRVGGDPVAFREALDAALASAVLVESDPDEDGQPEPAAPGDCDGHCTAAESLRVQLAQYKAERELLRAGVVPAGEALALLQLVTVAASARSRGADATGYFVPDIAGRAGVGAATVSRALGQLRRWQADPDLEAVLPFRVETVSRDGRSHGRLVLTPAGREMSRREMIVTLSRLPRDEQRQPHGGDRRCPRHPDAPVIRTRLWRCSVEGCGWVEQDTALLGRPDQDDAPEPFALTIVDQDDVLSRVPARPREEGHPDEPAGLTPVAFVSAEDQAAASGPRRHVEQRQDAGVSEPMVPPVAPASHRAWWSRPSGGES